MFDQRSLTKPPLVTIFQYKVETKDKETKPDLQRSLIDSQSMETLAGTFKKQNVQVGAHSASDTLKILHSS